MGYWAEALTMKGNQEKWQTHIYVNYLYYSQNLIVSRALRKVITALLVETYKDNLKFIWTFKWS
jgi:hypothetical protein